MFGLLRDLFRGLTNRLLHRVSLVSLVATPVAYVAVGYALIQHWWFTAAIATAVAVVITAFTVVADIEIRDRMEFDLDYIDHILLDRKEGS